MRCTQINVKHHVKPSYKVELQCVGTIMAVVAFAATLFSTKVQHKICTRSQLYTRSFVAEVLYAVNMCTFPLNTLSKSCWWNGLRTRLLNTDHYCKQQKAGWAQWTRLWSYWFRHVNSDSWDALRTRLGYYVYPWKKALFCSLKVWIVDKFPPRYTQWNQQLQFLNQRFAWHMASTLPLCFLRLWVTTLSDKHIILITFNSLSCSFFISSCSQSYVQQRWTYMYIA